LQLAPSDLEQMLAHGGLSVPTADRIVENLLGTYALPFGVGLNFRLNGEERLAPMVVEEPSVIAAASNAARIVRDAGGFDGALLGNLMTAQVQLHSVADVQAARERILVAAPEILALSRRAVPGLVARGCGPRALEVRDLGAGYLVVHLQLDCGDAMGANLANTVAEAIGPLVARLAGGVLGLRILSNLCDGRSVRVRCRAKAAELEVKPHCIGGQWSRGYSGGEVIDGIVRASEFAERDPYRAATHNKGIMNGIDAVAIATGNDFRAVEAGAHAYACRTGVYRPLSTWRRVGELLIGELELPLALGIVGGTARLHGAARLALRLCRVQSAGELALLAASVGLASNLAALRALATEGIQRGHMALHARSVAAATAARDDEVELLARALSESSEITPSAAERLLEELRRLPGAGAVQASLALPERGRQLEESLLLEQMPRW
jgi:hydroxymethylglutaryl-CoA reductase